MLTIVWREEIDNISKDNFSSISSTTDTHESRFTISKDKLKHQQPSNNQHRVFMNTIPTQPLQHIFQLMLMVSNSNKFNSKQ